MKKWNSVFSSDSFIRVFFCFLLLICVFGVILFCVLGPILSTYFRRLPREMVAIAVLTFLVAGMFFTHVLDGFRIKKINEREWRLKGYCESCGYNFQHTSTQCPECGKMKGK